MFKDRFFRKGIAARLLLVPCIVLVVAMSGTSAYSNREQLSTVGEPCTINMPVF
jgi:hypothetical protein